jgi:hypothetical protein
MQHLTPLVFALSAELPHSFPFRQINLVIHFIVLVTVGFTF